ncbi:MAG: hypothetical protein MK226_20575 [Saprospiraceae bacterium]|nr:hypothetical protein [Saprospiraceae bacterium]
MVVGGFASSFHNRARTSNDIDIVIQIYPRNVKNILQYLPEWMPFEEQFKDSVARGLIFNMTDFKTGIRYDFMVYQDSNYNWTAFQRRVQVNFFDTKCFISSKEDLVISKLNWYNISQSEKQLEDLKFLLLDTSLKINYIKNWVAKLNLKTYGLLES